MRIKHLVAALVAITITVKGAAAASPRGLEAGLLSRLDAIQSAGDDAVQSRDHGAVRTLPAVNVDSVLPMQVADDGSRFTLLRYSDAQAAGVRLHFRNMHLSSDARVYVYGISPEGATSDVYGPFTGAGPVQTGEFWTPSIRGTEAIVEVQFDRDVPSDLPFEVFEIGSLNLEALTANPAITQTIESMAPQDVRRSVYKGVVVDHEVRDGIAVFEGDIILGPINELQPVPAGKSAGHEGTATTWSWSRWPKGVVPYIIDSAMPNPSRITDAVAQWNSALNGAINIIPRTNESNYVVFAYTSNASYCASPVGMAGGPQYTYLGDYCGTGNVVHEIGHDLGLWHEHTRNDRNTYVNILTQNIISSAYGNFSQNGTNGVDLGAYDYNSIMHYPAYAFSSNGQVTIQTIPDGIPIGQRNGLSTGDIAAIAQIYGGKNTQPVTITESVNANPSGVALQVDGVTVGSPYSAQWTSGSTHTVSAPTPAPANGQQLVFSNWSDGGAQSHTVTASTTNSIVTANYVVSYLLSTQVSPAGTGSITANPATTSGYYAANATVGLTAVPAAGYCFSSWTGLLAGTPSQTSVTMTKAYTVVANFVTCTPVTIQSSTFTPIRVNAGGSAYTDPAGNIWSADTGFTNGSTYSVGSTINNTTTAPLYRSERYGNSTLQYMFSAPNATYTVNLKFAEIYYGSCGQRIFNIVINGQTVAQNFDPCAAAGAWNTAVDRAYTVSVTNGQINIQLVSVLSNPKISAIEIVAGGSTVTNAPTTPPPTTTTFSPIRVNAGGYTPYTDAAGQVWSTDTGYTNGFAYQAGNAIANSTTAPLYQSERYATGTLQYVFTVPNGSYTVNLKFAEIYYSVCGQRVFNIVINGQNVASSFDPCLAAGGWNRPVDTAFNTSVTNGQINIQLVPVVSNPKISAIEIVAGSTATTTPTTGFSAIRVNAGGPSTTDSAGQVWSADSGYSYVAGGAYGTPVTTSGTATPALYQSERYSVGPLQYAFSVPTGTYTVTLKFAEIYYGTCGQRVFNIVINGQTQVANFDPCAAAGGPNIAVDRQFTVASTGQVTIQLVPVVSNPKISAIEIK